MPQAQFVALVGPIEIKCRDDWNECQKQQACSKIRRMNTRAKDAAPGGLANISKTDPARYRKNAIEGPRHQKKYDGTNYAHECMRPKQGRAENQGRPVNADHIHEMQFGGPPEGPFMKLDDSVNKSIGSQLNKSPVTHLTGVTAANCEPAC